MIIICFYHGYIQIITQLKSHTGSLEGILHALARSVLRGSQPVSSDNYSGQCICTGGGACTDDIAKLRREVDAKVGMGAPTSEPDYGQRKGPNKASAQETAATTDSGAKPVGTPDTDRAQKGGASRESGGTPGTVGGVSGPVGAASGGGQADAVASGRIATSPDDVRRQSENRPTAAAAAAKGGDAKASSELSSEDKVSQAKAALQQAVDLNAKGDQSCRDALKEARTLIPR